MAARWQVGDRVRHRDHPEWGEGSVVGLYASGWVVEWDAGHLSAHPAEALEAA